MCQCCALCAGSHLQQELKEDGITYAVEWQVQTAASPAGQRRPRPGHRWSRRPSWQLSVYGRKPKTMRIRGSSADPARATVASLGQLQTVTADLELSPIGSSSRGRATLQLTTCGALATSSDMPSPATSWRNRSHAALLGIGKVMALEVPSLACSALDLDVQDAASLAAQDSVGATSSSSDGGGGDAHGIALRGGTCVAPRLLPMQAAAPATVAVLSAGPDRQQGMPIVTVHVALLHAFSNMPAHRGAITCAPSRQVMVWSDRSDDAQAASSSPAVSAHWAPSRRSGWFAAALRSLGLPACWPAMLPLPEPQHRRTCTCSAALAGLTSARWLRACL